MWVLQLNDMRSSKIEILVPVAAGPDKESLERFLERETVETYSDGKWGKTYRAGGPLEWFNKPWASVDHFVDVESKADWMQGAAERYDALMDGLLRVD